MKCPKCNKEIEYFDTYDHSSDGDYYYEFVWGECPQCKRQYEWVNYFKYEGSDELRECD